MTIGAAPTPLGAAFARASRSRASGPGLITGAADDDPSGIATYSQAGAQFGLDMLWTMPLAYPLMSAIQSLCALIGRTTGQGLAANIKTAFPPAVLKAVVLALLVANIAQYRGGRGRDGGGRRAGDRTSTAIS